MDTFDPQELQHIQYMELLDARVHCTNLIERTKTKQPKKAALLRDIREAPNSKELSRIMWNVMLSGEGLAITDSAWQKNYGTKK